MLDLVEDTDTSYLRQGKKKANKKLRAGIDRWEQANVEGQGYLDKAIPAYDDLFQIGKDGIAGYGKFAPDSGQAGVNAFNNSLDKRISEAGWRQGIDEIGQSYAGSGQVGRSMMDAMKFGDTFNRDILAGIRGYYTPYFGLGQGAASGLASVYGNKAQGAYGTAQGIGNLRTAQADNFNKFGENMTSVNMYDNAQDWGALLGIGELATGAFGSYMGKPK